MVPWSAKLIPSAYSAWATSLQSSIRRQGSIPSGRPSPYATLESAGWRVVSQCRISERRVRPGTDAMQRLNLCSVELDRADMILCMSSASRFACRDCRRTDVNNISGAMIKAVPQVRRCNRSTVARRRRINSGGAPAPARTMMPIASSVKSTIAIAVADTKAASAWHPSPAEAADIRPAAALEREPPPRISRGPAHAEASHIYP